MSKKRKYSEVEKTLDEIQMENQEELEKEEKKEEMKMKVKENLKKIGKIVAAIGVVAAAGVAGYGVGKLTAKPNDEDDFEDYLDSNEILINETPEIPTDYVQVETRDIET